MKTFVVILAFAIATVWAAAPKHGSEREAKILSQDQEVNFDGTYKSAYETSNGIVSQEQGVLKNFGQPEAEAEEVSGSVQWTAPDGTPVQLSYIANEYGYQPQGSHVPQIPAAIQRSLDYIAAHPPPEV